MGFKDTNIFIYPKDTEDTSEVSSGIRELNTNIDAFKNAVENLADSNKNVTIPLSQYNELLRKADVTESIKNMVMEMLYEYHHICNARGLIEVEDINQINFIHDSVKIINSFDVFEDPHFSQQLSFCVEVVKQGYTKSKF